MIGVKEAAPNPVARASRRGRFAWVKWVFFAGGVLLILALVTLSWLVSGAAGEEDLARELAWLEERGETTDWNEWLSGFPEVSDEENVAAHPVFEAEDLAKGLRVPGEQDGVDGYWFDSKGAFDPREAFFSVEPEMDRQEALKKLRAIGVPEEGAYELLLEALERPKLGLGRAAPPELHPFEDRMSDLQDVLVYQIRMDVLGGKRERAWRAIHAMATMPGKLKSTPRGTNMISLVHRVAWWCSVEGGIEAFFEEGGFVEEDRVHLEAIEESFAGVSVRELLDEALAMDRFMVMEVVNAVAGGGGGWETSDLVLAGMPAETLAILREKRELLAAGNGRFLSPAEMEDFERVPPQVTNPVRRAQRKFGEAFVIMYGGLGQTFQLQWLTMEARLAMWKFRASRGEWPKDLEEFKTESRLGLSDRIGYQLSDEGEPELSLDGELFFGDE